MDVNMVKMDMEMDNSELILRMCEQLSEIEQKLNNQEGSKIILTQIKNVIVLLNTLAKSIKELQNKSITIKYPHGTYTGEVANNKRNGKGKFLYINGNKYIGEFRDDQKDGRGTYYYNDGSKYEGDFRNSKKDGKGKFVFKNGDIYVGDFREDKKDGKGIYYYQNGNRYEGDWKNDLKEGNGVFYFQNEKLREMGDYSQDRPKGIHARLFENGKVKAYDHDKNKTSL